MQTRWTSTSHLALRISMALLLAPAAAVAGMVPESFQASNRTLFAKESTGVVFSVQATPEANGKLPPLALIQVDESGKRLQYFGIMSDDGVMGDRTAGDGTFSRRVPFNEKIPGTLRFEAIDETPGAAAGPRVSIEVIRRPSFVELVSRIWHRIRSAI